MDTLSPKNTLISTPVIFLINKLRWSDPDTEIQTHRDGRRIDIRANSLPTAIPEQNFDGFEMIVEDENCVAEIHNQGTNSQHYHMYCYEIGA